MTTDPGRHAAWHLECEGQGIPRGAVNAATVLKARGMVTLSRGSQGTGAMVRANRAARMSDPQRGAAMPRVGAGAPDTTQALSARLSPLRDRTVRLEVFALVAAWTPAVGGLTDDDLERLTGRAHQSVSATRNSLAADGYLEDSKARRQTRYGNDAIVWHVAPAAALAAGTYRYKASVLPEGNRLPWH